MAPHTCTPWPLTTNDTYTTGNGRPNDHRLHHFHFFVFQTHTVVKNTRPSPGSPPAAPHERSHACTSGRAHATTSNQCVRSHLLLLTHNCALLPGRSSASQPSEFARPYRHPLTQSSNRKLTQPLMILEEVCNATPNSDRWHRRATRESPHSQRSPAA
eukprot:scaffold23726_cov130-Isochrysis_galbana.AAC.2